MKPLSDRQSDFVSRYVSNGFNGHGAAIGAGYTKDYANVKTGELINRPQVQQAIQDARFSIDESLAKDLRVRFKDKIMYLARILEDILPSDGSTPKRQCYKDVMKAIDMLNKMQGHYMPEKSISVTVNATKERLAEIKDKYKDF